MGSQKTTKSVLAAHPEIDAPGLIWRPTKNGHTPYWRSPRWYVDKSGKWKGNVNLSNYAGSPAELAAMCVSLQAEANVWKAGAREAVGTADLTIGHLMHKYRTDPDSTFHALRHSSRHPYEYYADKIEFELGTMRIDEVTGIDLKRWHERWSDGGVKLAASKMARTVLDAAISFTIMSSKAGSAELRAASDLREILKTTSRKLPNPKRRESVVTADQVVALRAAAHEAGAPSRALVYALVFETTLRLWDVIGQWVPMQYPGVSDVVVTPHGRMSKAHKWFGLRWEDINDELVLHYTPSKTSQKTGLAVTFPLAKAPMVMEELAHWPEPRTGPVVVCEATGVPYHSKYFNKRWRADRKAVGIDDNVWARDMRASGISEGRAAAVATDDVAKVAGHSSTKTTSAIYDRAALEAAERFADARTKARGT